MRRPAKTERRVKSSSLLSRVVAVVSSVDVGVDPEAAAGGSVVIDGMVADRLEGAAECSPLCLYARQWIKIVLRCLGPMSCGYMKHVLIT